MDTWSAEQVENMKKNGNIAVNKTYNPKNKIPDMPLDADEVDSAMERFIRKKYQEKSLVDGRPEPPSRSAQPPRSLSRSPQPSPPPQLPPKKSKFFGFGLRASSSAYPLSKHDKKRMRNEPRVDSAFRISSEDHTSRRTEISEHELQVKLAQLRDMGFPDTERNISILKRMNGDIERTIAKLVKLGPSDTTNPRAITRPDTMKAIPAMPQASESAQNSPVQSNNPWGQPQSQDFGISFATQDAQPVQQVSTNNNPWQSAIGNQPQPQPQTGLEHQFGAMSVAQPLFPHNTGGYPAQVQPQQDFRLQAMTPHVHQALQSQWQYNDVVSAPASAAGTNPFHQQQMSPSSSSSNPFMQASQVQPNTAPSNNPFFNTQSQAVQQGALQQTSAVPGYNPFGLPPSQQSTVPIANFQQPSMNPFDMTPQNNPYQQAAGSVQNQQPPPQPQSPGQFPNFQYGQPQQSPHYQQNIDAYAAQSQIQPQHQPMMPQQTGRYDKSSILALFNHPQFAPQQQTLAPIHEPSDEATYAQNGTQNFHHQQPISSTPSSDMYTASNTIPNIPARRSATMPVSSSTMHSAGGNGMTSRNPFLSNPTSRTASNASTNTVLMHAPQQPAQGFPQAYAQGSRHASADSVVVNNPHLMDGRHSPDAFASLSARYTS